MMSQSKHFFYSVLITQTVCPSDKKLMQREQKERKREKKLSTNEKRPVKPTVINKWSEVPEDSAQERI